MDVKCTIKIKIDNKQSKAIGNAIINFINDQIGKEGSQGQMQEEVLDELQFDDDVGFCDIGVSVETKWEHDWL